MTAPNTTPGPVNYANLTSGLEIAPTGSRLVRVQSSRLESKALWPVIADLDYGFLFDAAMHGVRLFDCGSRGGPISRAQWQGIPWICFAYQMANGLHIDAPITRGVRVGGFFAERYRASHPAREQAINKLRYVYRLTGAPALRIASWSECSTLDGDYAALAERLTA